MDFRVRLREHNARPKAVEALRNSLNLSTTFLVQINNLTDKDEIYTAKDLEDIQKIINETTVRAVIIATLPEKLIAAGKNSVYSCDPVLFSSTVPKSMCMSSFEEVLLKALLGLERVNMTIVCFIN